MRRHRVIVFLSGAAALSCAAPLVAAGAAVAGVVPATAIVAAQARPWGRAKQVPGLAALNKGGNAQILSLSCTSAGNCAAGGFYTDRAGHELAFVVNERNGTWHKAIRVPGFAGLNGNRNANVESVSCASAGNCAAGGLYIDGAGHEQAFVVTERNGTWRRAIEVPGSGNLNVGGESFVESVSCGSVGSCAAVGFYTDGSGHFQAFVVSERNGAWPKAIEVPGLAALNAGGNAIAFSVSCRSRGNCTAGGNYKDGSAHQQAFVVSERNGRWRTAIEVPGSGTLNSGGAAGVTSVACASAGNCAAGGFYVDGSSHTQAFVVSERNGTWRTAIQVPGSAILNGGGEFFIVSMSCGSAGSCAAGGFYRDGSNHLQAFLESKRNGAWHNAIEVPGSGTLNKGGDANVSSVSCGSAGNCAAGGFYTGSSSRQAFLVSEQNGVWLKAAQVPGLASLNAGGFAGVTSFSCVSSGHCVAAGVYSNRPVHLQSFVVGQR